MKIIWNENPLATVVQLDDSDRQTLKAKLKADEPDIDDLDEQAAMYEAELARSHGGDCTCFPVSCPKCYAEGLLGVDTIAGLDKHEGAAIAYAFHPLEGGAPNLAEVLESLRNHNPVKGPAWKRFSDDAFQRHVPRWKEEARRAYEWLVAHLARHQTDLQGANSALSTDDT